ncbi:MAG: hypothetical protein KatS3mg113_0256 [Planctomycetaceae bacterium]|nr:MAG: hypothetical protein KatS3mg113_0256 [Planctomycetaceae bacterium]
MEWFVFFILTWMKQLESVETSELSLAAKMFPPELTAWVPAASEPVFTARSAPSWDRRIRERGWIIIEDGLWRLWYTGYDGQRDSRKHLGHAISPDGLLWIRTPPVPLIDHQWVEDVCVVKRDDTYYLFAEGEQDRAQLFQSNDGLNWKHLGRLNILTTRGEPISEGPYGTPAVYLEPTQGYLFYERRDGGVWLATSHDLLNWRHVQDEPVLTPGPASYDRDLIAVNQVFRHGEYYYAVYHGARRTEPPVLWSSGLAASRDLIHWTKYPGNPLRPVAENKSSGIMLHSPQGWRFYTMHDRVEVHVPARSP